MLAVIMAVALVAPEKPGDSAKVKELQKERIATLSETVHLTLKLAQAGRISVGEVLDARTILLKAEMELAEKNSDRVALYKQAVDSLTEYEKLAKAQWSAGRDTELNMLKVKARRLEFQIALEKLSAK